MEKTLEELLEELKKAEKEYQKKMEQYGILSNNDKKEKKDD